LMRAARPRRNWRANILEANLSESMTLLWLISGY
jgi:hypothetical protein